MKGDDIYRCPGCSFYVSRKYNLRAGYCINCEIIIEEKRAVKDER